MRASAHTVGEAYLASAPDRNVTKGWLARKLVEVSVNMKLPFDVHVGCYPVLKDEGLIIAHIFRHVLAHLWYRQSPQRILFLEQPLSRHEVHMYIVQSER